MRKPNRSRRIVKKLLKRADRQSADECWHRDAISVDGGKRFVTGVEMRHHDIQWFARDGNIYAILFF